MRPSKCIYCHADISDRFCRECGSYYLNTRFLPVLGGLMFLTIVGLLAAGLVTNSHDLQTTGDYLFVALILFGVLVFTVLSYFALPKYHWYRKIGPRK